MAYTTLARYFAQGWRTEVPTRRGWANGNPELICHITVLRRGREEIVVYTDPQDGSLICSEPRKYSKH